MNTYFKFVKIPEGMVKEDTFELIKEEKIPEPADGEVLVKTTFLTVDPYLRGKLMGATYNKDEKPLLPGNPMISGSVGVVEVSKDPNVPVGASVLCQNIGWAKYGISSTALGMIPFKMPAGVPDSLALGCCGMPGVTAYYGLEKIGQPKEGETVVISAAAGAVGSVLIQLCKKVYKARVVAIAGGPTKTALCKELGADVVIDYKNEPLYPAMAAACPEGIDMYWDNVGGETLDIALALANKFSRFVMCGMIGFYNGQEPFVHKSLMNIIMKSVKMQGFIVADDMEFWVNALGQLPKWVADGTIVYKETVVEGFENTPKAFIDLFAGKNIGKMIVKV